MAQNAATQDNDAAGLSIPEEDRFRQLVDAVTDYAIFMIDPAGHVASWNPGAERAKGYTREEILGEHFSRFYTEEDRRCGLHERALGIAASEGRFEGEGWRVRKDGVRTWAHVIIDPIRNADGGLIGFAKIARDITDRHRAQEALRQSEEQFRQLVEGVSDYAIFMIDPDGYVTNWNSGARRTKGYTADEIVGRHFSQFYTPQDRDSGEPQRALETAAREGRYEKEAQRVRKDGARFWAHVVLTPIRDNDGKLLGFAKITRDVTERVRAQAELEETREAFHQAQKMESLGQLTGGIAHDFNNLLMAVLSSLEMLRKRLPEDPRLTQLLDNAVQGAQLGAALTQRMLSFARRQSLDPRPVDVPALVAGLKGLLERTIGPGFEMEMSVAGNVRAALVDANQLELAIINLALNARDAMPGGGKITFAIREDEVADEDGLAPGPYVVLALTDTGEGMDEDTLRRATEPFFTTKGVGRGTGLGLSMVHGFAEQLSGRLKLESRKGIGTTAEIWMPVATGESEALIMPEPENETPARAGQPRSLLVLAVDDDPLIQMNNVAMLEELGHRVIEASNGAEALDIVRSTPEIDIVLTDHVMPKMTGGDLVRAIARERPGLQVILATGHADFPAGERAPARILQKPFGMEDLARVLKP